MSYDWRQLQGFDHSLEKLKALRQTNRLPPVLLLEGHAGIGKSKLAAAVAALYVCETASACGECPSCRDVAYGRHGDVFWLETEEDRLKIENAARLQEHLQYNPAQGSNKFPSVRVAVAIDVDKLVPQAANRLLKTLEEPPPRGRIILTTSRYQNLLETIRSRCVKWHLRLPVELAGDPRERLDQKLRDDLLQFLEAKSDSEAVILAQELQKKFSLSAVELGRTAELVLNQHYRNVLINNQQQGSAIVGISRIQRRRQQLRDLRRLAERQQITLNPQLSLESLVLFK